MKGEIWCDKKKSSIKAKREEREEQWEKCHADPRLLAGGRGSTAFWPKLCCLQSAVIQRKLAQVSAANERPARTEPPFSSGGHVCDAGWCTRQNLRFCRWPARLTGVCCADAWRDSEGVEAGLEAGAGEEEALGGMLASIRYNSAEWGSVCACVCAMQYKEVFFPSNMSNVANIPWTRGN